MMTFSATFEELKPHLISLLRMKVILSKDKELKENTSFKFNQKFFSPKIALTLPIPIIKEDPVKRQERDINLQKSRAIKVDAILVRTMKARKACTHNILISDTTS